LQEEVEEQRKLIKKLRARYKSAINEVKDLAKEHEGGREDLLDTIRILEKDNKLLTAVVEMLMSPDEFERVKAASEWSDEKNEYKVPPFIFKEKKLMLPRLP